MKEDEPSRLDLIFTKELLIMDGVKYKSPIGKCDHVLIECILKEEGLNERNEEHRKEWFNYNKTDVLQLQNTSKRCSETTLIM